jgi:hypothetical protein
VCKYVYCADDNYIPTLHETINSAFYVRLILSLFIDQLTHEENTYCHVSQDNATVHTANNSMDILDEVFGER